MAGLHTIDSLLDGIVTLPSLPASVASISQLLKNPNVSLSEVGKAIQADPALAIKTLRLVNSAYYGLPQKVTAVEHAVALLGLKVVRNLVFTATVFDSFRKSTDTLLRHSLSCGMAMRVIAEQNAFVSVELDEAFVYGLLHDIGKIILYEFLPKETEKIFELSKTGKMTTFDAERAIIGVDHAEVGSRLVQKWGLSEDLSHAIAAHHDLSRCPGEARRPLAAALAIADYICNASGLSAVPGSVTSVIPEAWEALGLTNRSIPPLLDAFFGSLPTVDELMSVAA